MLGTAQRKSLRLWLPSLGLQVTAGDLLLERLNQSPVQTRASPYSQVSRQSDCKETVIAEGVAHGTRRARYLPGSPTGFRTAASPSLFLPEDLTLLKNSPSPVEPFHVYPSSAALSLVPTLREGIL